MAIAKMLKLAAIVEEENCDRFIQAMQACQGIQVKPLDGQDKDGIDLDEEADRLIASLEDVRSAQSFLESYLPSLSFKEKYLTALPEYQMTELEVAQPLERIKEVTDRVWTKKKELEKLDSHLQNNEGEDEFLSKWQNLKNLPATESTYQHTELILGTLPQTADNQYINALKKSDILYLEEIYQNRDEIGLVVAFDRDQAYEANQILSQNRFQALDYKFTQLPSKSLKDLRQNSLDLRKQSQQVRKELGSFKKEYQELKLAEEVLFAQVERRKAQGLGFSKGKIFALEGWIPETQAQAVVAKLEKEFGNQVYLGLKDIGQEEEDQVPVKLTNHPLVEPFETVTTMYGLPSYKGMDPTLSLAPYYWIFFGMMLADLGYGILLWLFTFIPLKFFTLDEGMKKSIKFFHFLSYSTILWGLIYGSFFGEALPFSLLSPTEDVIQVLAISVGIGFVHIIHGLILNTLLNWKEDKLGAIKDGLSWIIMLVGFLIAALGPIVLKIDSLKNFGLYLAGLAALTILIIAIIKSKNKAAGLAAGLYDLYGVSSYLGDLVSYSRLMALGISGGSIAMAFNTLIAYMPPVARFSIGIVLIIVLQLFNFSLSVLSSYVHSARLIFVEFFGKFYEAGGQAFAPLKYLGKHINIK